MRLSKVAKELNVGISTIVDYLNKKGKKIETSPNTKIESELYEMLLKAFPHDREKKNVSNNMVKVRPVDAVVIQAEDVVAKQKDSDEDFVDGEEVFIKSNTIEFKPESSKTQKVEPKFELETEKVEQRIAVEEPKVDEVKKTKIEETIEIEETEESSNDSSVKILGKIDLDSINTKVKPDRKTKAQKEKEKAEKKKAVELKKKEKKQPVAEKPNPNKEKNKQDKKEKPQEVVNKVVEVEKPIEQEDEKDKFIKTNYVKLEGPKITGEKIDLSSFEKKKKNPVATSSKGKVEKEDKDKKKRKRIKPSPLPTEQKTQQANNQPNPKKDKAKHNKNKKEPVKKVELSETEIEKQIKDTLARLSPMGKSKTSKHRRDKRQIVSQQIQEEKLQELEEQKILKVTEFVTANELATMMNVPVNKIIASCMTLGMFVSINQRLDAEAIQLIADEFGYSIKFVSADVVEALSSEEEEDKPVYREGNLGKVVFQISNKKVLKIKKMLKVGILHSL